LDANNAFSGSLLSANLQHLVGIFGNPQSLRVYILSVDDRFSNPYTRANINMHPLIFCAKKEFEISNSLLCFLAIAYPQQAK